jgi:hypothetical protein
MTNGWTRVNSFRYRSDELLSRVTEAAPALAITYTRRDLALTFPSRPGSHVLRSMPDNAKINSYRHASSVFVYLSPVQSSVADLVFLAHPAPAFFGRMEKPPCYVAL